MKIWLDDVRYPPKGWTWVKSFAEAVACFRENKAQITDASLDHDLGFPPEAAGVDLFDIIDFPYDKTLPTGYDFVRWIWEQDVWPSRSLGIHSANPTGSRNMQAVIERYGPYVYRREFKSDTPSAIWGVVYEKDDVNVGI